MMRAEHFTALEGSSMSYGADFAAADPANAPLNPTIMIGADPFFWAAILLMLAAAAFAGYFFGQLSRNRRDAAKAIWQAIRDAAQSAMGADDYALKGRAEALSRVIQERLGKTLKLAGGLSGLVKTLDNAIAGRGPVQMGPARDQVTGRSGESGRGEAAGGQSGQGGGGGGGGGAAAASSVTVVTIGGSTAQPPQPPPPPAANVRDLTHREQTDALRLAVAALNEHWRDEAARVGELRAAHAELSNPGPARTSSGHGKVHQGGH